MSKTNIKSISVNTRTNKAINVNIYKNNNHPANRNQNTQTDLKSLKFNSNNHNNITTKTNTSFTNNNNSLNLGQKNFNKFGNEYYEMCQSKITDEDLIQKLDEKGEIENIKLLQTIYKTHSKANFLKAISDNVQDNDRNLNSVMDATKSRVINSSYIPSKPDENQFDSPDKSELLENNKVENLENNAQDINIYLRSSNMTFKTSNLHNDNEELLKKKKKDRNYSNNNNNNNELATSGLGSFVNSYNKEESIIKSNFSKSKSNKNLFSNSTFHQNQNTVKSINLTPYKNLTKSSANNSLLVCSNMIGLQPGQSECEVCEELKREIVKLRKEKMELNLKLSQCKKDLKKVSEENDANLKLLSIKEKQCEKDRDFMLKQDKEIDRLSSIIEAFNPYFSKILMSNANTINKNEKILDDNELLNLLKKENPLKTLNETFNNNSNNINNNYNSNSNYNTKNVNAFEEFQPNNNSLEMNKTLKVDFKYVHNLNKIVQDDHLQVEENKMALENEKDYKGLGYDSENIVIKEEEIKEYFKIIN